MYVSRLLSAPTSTQCLNIIGYQYMQIESSHSHFVEKDTQFTTFWELHAKDSADAEHERITSHTWIYFQ